MQVHLGHQVWPYLACQASLINHHHKQRHMLTKKSKVTCLTIGLETGAEPIHTCPNRTSHLQRSPLLPTVASRSFWWRPLGSLTSRRPPSALPSITGQASFVPVDGWVAVLLLASSTLDVDALDAKDYRVLVTPVALPPQRHARTGSHPGPRWPLI